MLSVQTLHTLQVQASELEAAGAGDRSLFGRLRRSIGRALGTGPAAAVTTPTALRTHVTVCDLVHSRKMVFYMLIMCSLWSESCLQVSNKLPTALAATVTVA